MNFGLIFLLSLGLAMDAFAVSMTNGMCIDLPRRKNAIFSGLAFGIAQGIMPLIGYLAGTLFSSFVVSVDHWLAVILLSVIGGKMIFEGYRDRKDKKQPTLCHFSFKHLIIQAIATSIDALAVGVSLGVMKVNVYLVVSFISIITFICCIIGVCLGKAFGKLLQDKAQFVGGAILIFIGFKIFFNHMGIFL